MHSWMRHSATCKSTHRAFLNRQTTLDLWKKSCANKIQIIEIKIYNTDRKKNEIRMHIYINASINNYISAMCEQVIGIFDV